MNWYFKLSLLLLWLLVAQCRNLQLNKQELSTASLLQLDSNYQNIDAEAAALIAPYKKALDSQMNDVIGYSLVDLYKQRPEGPLGNWAADAVLWRARNFKKDAIIICMLNHGGLRTDVASGPITLGKIYEVMPFDNELVLLGLNKDEVIQLVNTNLSKGGDPIAGIQIKSNCGQKNSITINGKSWDQIANNAVIWLATSDYMANGGDDYSLLEKISIRISTGLLIRDNLIEYLKFETANQLSIDSRIEGRINICK